MLLWFWGLKLESGLSFHGGQGAGSCDPQVGLLLSPGEQSPRRTGGQEVGGGARLVTSEVSPLTARGQSLLSSDPLRVTASSRGSLFAPFTASITSTQGSPNIQPRNQAQRPGSELLDEVDGDFHLEKYNIVLLN